jgi:hypothetical protein
MRMDRMARTERMVRMENSGREERKEKYFTPNQR